MTKGLTERQEVVLEFLDRFDRERGYAPSVAEVGEAFDIQPNAARGHLLALERKGFITRDGNRSRSIRIQRAPPTLSGWIAGKLGRKGRPYDREITLIRFHIGWTTHDRKDLLNEPLREAIRKKLSKIKPLGADVKPIEVTPDSVTVEVEPPGDVDARELTGILKRATFRARVKGLGLLKGSGLWAPGALIATDPREFERIWPSFLGEAGSPDR